MPGCDPVAGILEVPSLSTSLWPLMAWASSQQAASGLLGPLLGVSGFSHKYPKAQDGSWIASENLTSPASESHFGRTLLDSIGQK